MSSLTSNNFLYLTANGLLNPQASVKQTDFTYTFINTISTYTRVVLLFTISLSYSVSEPPPFGIQIGAILFSHDKYFLNSKYTFVFYSFKWVGLTITKKITKEELLKS